MPTLEFGIISEGKLKVKPTVSTDEPAKLGSVCDAYYKDQLDKADTTLVGETTHINHLKKLLGAKTKLESLTLEAFQGYVNSRRKAEQPLRREGVGQDDQEGTDHLHADMGLGEAAGTRPTPLPHQRPSPAPQMGRQDAQAGRGREVHDLGRNQAPDRPWRTDAATGEGTMEIRLP